jgi:hypothetical protein
MTEICAGLTFAQRLGIDANEVFVSAVVLAVGLLASVLRMDALPVSYGRWLLIVTAGYGLAAQLVKRRYLRHQQIWR